MKITAHVSNTSDQHRVVVTTNGAEKILAIEPKATSRGSSVNGGELLLAALATCVCNDLFREAAKREIHIENVDVVAAAVFRAEGASADHVEYQVTLSGAADDSVLRDLVRTTDTVAEIQNTVRVAIPVALSRVTVVPRGAGTAISSA